MIHPSYTELIEAINANANSEEESSEAVLNSRYSLVLATSKRARQLIAGARPLVSGAAGKKPLSIAIDELYKGKVKILPPNAKDQLESEDLAEAPKEIEENELSGSAPDDQEEVLFTEDAAPQDLAEDDFAEEEADKEDLADDVFTEDELV